MNIIIIIINLIHIIKDIKYFGLLLKHPRFGNSLSCDKIKLHKED
jgi:hypothetical protein